MATAIFADRCTSISAFKRQPARIVEEHKDEVLMVLNHNAPAFYCLSPELFESMMERLEDAMLLEIAQERRESPGESIIMDFDDI